MKRSGLLDALNPERRLTWVWLELYLSSEMARKWQRFLSFIPVHPERYFNIAFLGANYFNLI